METKLIQKDNRLPPWFMFVYMPINFSVVAYLLWLTWNYEGALPLSWTGMTNTEIAVKCCGLATLPMILSVFVIIGFRLLTAAADPLLGAESPMMKTQLNVLQNNFEGTFIFCMNLLAASSYKDFPAERSVALAWFFVAGRFVFWVGYILATKLNMPFLRGPGFATTLQVNVLLFAYNLSGFFS